MSYYYEPPRDINPPEPEDEPVMQCARCERDLYEYDDFYEPDGEPLCEDCAWEWLKEQRQTVTKDERI